MNDGPPSSSAGANFFDEHRSDRGWASKIVRRERPLGRLTILDVTTNEVALASFLRALDRAPLRVQHAGLGGESYTFVWASGYENGAAIRVQGILEQPPQ